MMDRRLEELLATGALCRIAWNGYSRLDRDGFNRIHKILDSANRWGNRISHRLSTAEAQTGMSAALRSVGLLDALSSTSAGPSVARLVSTPVCASSLRSPVEWAKDSASIPKLRLRISDAVLRAFIRATLRSPLHCARRTEALHRFFPRKSAVKFMRYSRTSA